MLYEFVLPILLRLINFDNNLATFILIQIVHFNLPQRQWAIYWYATASSVIVAFGGKILVYNLKSTWRGAKRKKWAVDEIRKALTEYEAEDEQELHIHLRVSL